MTATAVVPNATAPPQGAAILRVPPSIAGGGRAIAIFQRGALGSHQNLYLASYGQNGIQQLNSAPTEYGNALRTISSSDNTGDCSVGTARRVLPAQNDDPGPFSLGGSDAWAAITTVVEPAVPSVAPTVESTTATQFGADATAHLVAMPATVNAGDLLVMFWTNDNEAVAPTTPSGWTAKRVAASPANGVQHAVFVKDADGTEGGTTVDVVTGSGERAAAQVYRISGWAGEIATDMVVSTAGTGTSSTPDPPNVTDTWSTGSTGLALQRSDETGEHFGDELTIDTNDAVFPAAVMNPATGDVHVVYARLGDPSLSSSWSVWTRSLAYNGAAWTVGQQLTIAAGSGSVGYSNVSVHHTPSGFILAVYYRKNASTSEVQRSHSNSAWSYAAGVVTGILVTMPVHGMTRVLTMNGEAEGTAGHIHLLEQGGTYFIYAQDTLTSTATLAHSWFEESTDEYDAAFNPTPSGSADSQVLIVQRDGDSIVYRTWTPATNVLTDPTVLAGDAASPARYPAVVKDGTFWDIAWLQDVAGAQRSIRMVRTDDFDDLIHLDTDAGANAWSYLKLPKQQIDLIEMLFFLWCEAAEAPYTVFMGRVSTDIFKVVTDVGSRTENLTSGPSLAEAATGQETSLIAGEAIGPATDTGSGIDTISEFGPEVVDTIDTVESFDQRRDVDDTGDGDEGLDVAPDLGDEAVSGDETLLADEQVAAADTVEATDSPVEALSVYANVVDDAVRTAALEGDGRDPEGSVGIWEASENLVPNGGFETDTTGWTDFGGTTHVRTTGASKFGAAAVEVTSPGGTGWEFSNAAGLAVISGATAGRTFTGSTWLRGVGSAVGRNIRVVTRERGGAVGTGTLALSGNVTLAADWQRVALTGTVVENDRTGISIGIVTGTTNTPLVDEVFQLDGVQVEEQSIATPYVETDGAPASRPAADVQLPTASVLAEGQGWAAFKVRPGWANDADIHGASNPLLLSWLRDSNNRIEVRVLASNDAVGVVRVAPSGNSQKSFLLVPWVADDVLTIVARWEAGRLGVSVNGAGFEDDTGTQHIPAIAGAVHLGSSAVPDLHFDADVLWAVFGTGVLTDADAAQLAALSDEPYFQLLAPDAKATAIWLANDGTYLKTSGLVVGLNPAEVGLVSEVFSQERPLAETASGAEALKGGPDVADTGSAVEDFDQAGFGFLIVVSDTGRGEDTLGGGGGIDERYDILVSGAGPRLSMFPGLGGLGWDPRAFITDEQDTRLWAWEDIYPELFPRIVFATYPVDSIGWANGLRSDDQGRSLSSTVGFTRMTALAAGSDGVLWATGNDGTSASGSNATGMFGWAKVSRQVFKSVNQGLSWTRVFNVDQQPGGLGVGNRFPHYTQIAIDPSNPQRVMVSGVRRAAVNGGEVETLSSSDGGDTWVVRTNTPLIQRLNSLDGGSATFGSEGLLLGVGDGRFIFAGNTGGLFQGVARVWISDDLGGNWVVKYNFDHNGAMRFSDGVYRDGVLYLVKGVTGPISLSVAEQADNENIIRSDDGMDSFTVVPGFLAGNGSPSSSGRFTSIAYDNRENVLYIGSRNGGHDFVHRMDDPPSGSWESIRDDAISALGDVSPSAAERGIRVLDTKSGIILTSVQDVVSALEGLVVSVEVVDTGSGTETTTFAFNVFDDVTAAEVLARLSRVGLSVRLFMHRGRAILRVEGPIGPVVPSNPEE